MYCHTTPAILTIQVQSSLHLDPTPHPPPHEPLYITPSPSLSLHTHSTRHTQLHRHSTPLPSTAHAQLPHHHIPYAPHDCHIVIALYHPLTYQSLGRNTPRSHHTPISHVPSNIRLHSTIKSAHTAIQTTHASTASTPLTSHPICATRLLTAFSSTTHTAHALYASSTSHNRIPAHSSRLQHNMHACTALPHNHPACLLRRRSHHATYLSIHASTCSAARLQSIPTPPRPSHNNTKHQRRHQTPITTPNTNDNNKHQQPPTHHHNHQPNITSPHSRE